ncbi:hypothetical protein QE412_000063 [Microbacterium trichothecenolyticum]|uniref:Uncharacterized protein n=1 Tax=Microbacterium trichothecenolyticum TaxID=69370 RepID=A0ABU0TPD7_MICTR|nr:hypothetical protein [Microbacterium trichothecenolyticum]
MSLNVVAVGGGTLCRDAGAGTGAPQRASPAEHDDLAG